MSTISASTTTTTAYKVTADTTGTLVLQTGATPTTAVTIDGSQNVGIGTSSPSTKLDVRGAAGAAAGEVDIKLVDDTSGKSVQLIRTGATFSYAGIGGAEAALYTASNNLNIVADGGAVKFSTGVTAGSSSERARIDSSGNLLVGTTSAPVSGLVFSKAINNPFVSWNPSTSGNSGFIDFGTEATYTERGYIYYNRGAGQTQLSATSDVRLKENIVDAPSALSIIDEIKVRQFDWRETGNTNIGFIAQELHEVVPQAVCVGEDNDDGTIKRHWGVSKEYLVPYLVKAIQEQQAMISSQAADIQQLTARIETLEAK